MNKDIYFDNSNIYNEMNFKVHIEDVKRVDFFDDITSSVARCVEFGLKSQLELLLSNLDKLLSMAVHVDKVFVLDKRLLRRINFECYFLANKFGFNDPELESRIILIQRLLRKQESPLIVYKGPTPEEYFGLGDNTFSEDSERYWGYQQTLYYIKWNKVNRLKIVKLIKDFWWGDSRYQAYVDYLESGNDENMKFHV